MRGPSRAAALALSALFCVLFALLVLLSAGLANVRLQPGTPIYMPGTDTEAAEDGELLPLPPMTRRDRILAYILGGLTVLSIVGALISRKLRKLLFQQLFSILGVVLPVMLAALFIGRLIARWLRRHATGIPDPGPVIPESLLSNPPTWAIALSAVAIGLVLTGIVLYLLWRGARIRAYLKTRRERLREQDALRDGVAEAAEEAAQRIRGGYDPQSAVVRCYRQMMLLLASRENVAHTYLTPREFECALGSLGISDGSIGQLTEMFEFVRYGDRDDEAFRDRALACMDALTASYQEALSDDV